MTDSRRRWSEIEPIDAVNLQLPHPDIIGAVNELGEECPWPWEPQQLVGAPLGQYPCPYCGGMVMAGMPHLDWTPEDLAGPLPDTEPKDRS